MNEPSVDSREVPEHVGKLYEKPQTEWGVDEWQTLALHLLAELQQANNTANQAIDVAAKANNVAAQAVASAKNLRAKVRLLTKLLHSIERSLDEGQLVPAKPRGKPGRPRRDPTEKVKSRDELVALAREHGWAKAAEIKARQQLDSEGLRLPNHQKTFKTYITSWGKRISEARSKEAADRLSPIHGESLAFIGALMDEGFGKHRKRKRSQKI